MPAVLKPDLKAVVWLGIGAFAVPYALKVIASRR
jgi:hypothetical protein